MVHPGAFRWGLALAVVGVCVGVGAGALARAAHPVPAVLVAWGAVSALCAAGLYLAAGYGRHVGYVLKGERWGWLQPAFLPFRAVSWGVFHVARWVRHSHPANEVVPGLYVGGRPMPREARALAAAGVRSVLDLAAELPTGDATGAPTFERLQVPVLDRTGPSDADLDRAVAWVMARTGPDASVLVHCAFGRGRSGLVACAVVLARGLAEDPVAARALVTRARPSVQVEGDQFEVLRRFHARRRMG